MQSEIRPSTRRPAPPPWRRRAYRSDIVGDGVREQIDPLEHEGEIADETVVAVSGAYRKLQDYKAVLQEQEENLE